MTPETVSAQTASETPAQTPSSGDEAAPTLRALPAWVEIVAGPLFSLFFALLIAGVTISLVGENPFAVFAALARGSQVIINYSDVGLDAANVCRYETSYALRPLSNTLYFTSSLTFTGLAVAVAFRAGHFNIGGEGQALIAGLGVGLFALWLAPLLLGEGSPNLLMLLLFWLLTIAAAVLFGALWILVPALLQAYRGSHIVITTIMFNAIASAVLTALLTGPLKPPNSGSEVRSASLPEAALLPRLPLDETGVGNASLVLALVAVGLVWFLFTQTRWGLAIRATGQNQDAARYGGLDPRRVTVGTLCLSGGLAGLMAVNVILGNKGHIDLDIVSGLGFTGIAVALLGRSHPLGVLFAAFVFGILLQGGTSLQSFRFFIDEENCRRGFIAFDRLDSTLAQFLQGLIVLFVGALGYLPVLLLRRLWRAVQTRRSR